MKMKLLKPSFLIILMLIPLIIQTVKAAPVTKEYDQDFYYQADKLFIFKAKITIETEPNGKWKLDTYYQENITLTITYLNETRLNANDFRLLFYSPQLMVNELPSGHGTFNIVNGSANVTIRQNGTISLKYSPHTLDGEKIQLKPTLEYTIYENNQPWSIKTGWASPEPIIIETESPNAENPTPNYAFTPNINTGILIIALIIGTLVILKLRKTKRKRQQSTFKNT